MNFARADQEWEPLQVKSFTRWVSSHLAGHCEQKIDDITKDLSNGVALIDLAAALTQKKLPYEWARSPKKNAEMIQNCDLALDMFSKDGVCVSGISSKDINENNEKVILRLIWALVLHYSICPSVISESIKENKEDGSLKWKNYKDALMAWAIDRISNYPNVDNSFHPYDLSMCALLDYYIPERINFYSLNMKDSENNSKLVINVMKDLGIPIFIYPSEITENNIDEKSLLAQLSSVKVVLESLQKNESIQKVSIGIENEDDCSAKDEIDEANKDKEIAEIDRLKRELVIAKSNLKVLNVEQEKASLKNQKLMQQIEQLSTVYNSNNEVRKLNSTLKDEKELRENTEKSISEMKVSYDNLENEFKQYKLTSEKYIKEILNELNSIKSDNQKQKETIKIQEEKIQQQKEDLGKSEKNIILLTSVLKESQKETKMSKARLRESEQMIKSLSETLNQLHKETRYRYQVDSTEISNALLDAQNEREAKESAQSGVESLTRELEKSVAEATIAKNAQKVAFQNVNELTKQLEIALEEADKNKSKADEAERIAFNLSNQLNDLHQQFIEDEKEKDTKIAELEKENDSLRKEKEDSIYEIERLSNVLFESEEIAEHQKNQADFEIDRLTGQIGDLQSDIEDFKEANENLAIKIQKLSTELNKAQSEAKESKNKEIEATRIAQQLSKQLSEFDARNKNQPDLKNVLVEVDRLKNALVQANAEILLQKSEKEKVKSNLALLNDQFEKLFIEMQKNKLAKIEAERMANDLSKSLNEALKESKTQREEDQKALKETREIAVKEKNEKEAAIKEVNRLTKS